MHVHILGVCGTFMAGVAILARELGHRVTGSDANTYPPMSHQLGTAGIEVRQGYDPAHLEPAPDCVVVGNALSRGNPAVESMLDRGLPFMSGPEWMARHLLHGKWVLAIAGTHGKTTTTSLLAWILEEAGKAPGFLVGGIPDNFCRSARAGASEYFVIEADEYDTAFFDKRSKFVHYHPRTLVLANLEYDHADIFADLAAIKQQFHHLVRTVPGSGRICHRAADPGLESVLEMGCWTPTESFGLEASGADWRARLIAEDGTRFEITRAGETVGEATWGLPGTHNVENALAAVAAAAHVGVDPARACRSLSRFAGVKRRLEVRGVVDGVTVYDDFAHHPTAIAATIAGLRSRIGRGRILAALEPRSNTMRLGVHRGELARALSGADLIWMQRPEGLCWDPGDALRPLGGRARIHDSVDTIVEEIRESCLAGDHVLVMSNGAFGGIHTRLLEALRAR